jgi:hypothetical protein
MPASSASFFTLFILVRTEGVLRREEFFGKDFEMAE